MLSAYYRCFDLCNEQVFLHDNERLNEETWLQWRAGIAGNVRRKAFRVAWEEHIRPCIGKDFGEFKRLYKELAAEQRHGARERLVSRQVAKPHGS